MLTHQEQRRLLAPPKKNGFGRPKVAPKPVEPEPQLKSTDHLMVVKVKPIGFTPKDEWGNEKLDKNGDPVFISLGIGVYMMDGGRYLKAFTKRVNGRKVAKHISPGGTWSLKYPNEEKGRQVASSDGELRRVMSTRLADTLITSVRGYIDTH